VNVLERAEKCTDCIWFHTGMMTSRFERKNKSENYSVRQD